MGAEASIAVWWVLFGGTHVAGSSVPVRRFLIGRFGLRGFKTLYSVVAFATFIPLCWVYFANKHAGRLLFTTTPGLLLAAQALMLIALIVLAQGLATPSPLTTQAEMTGTRSSRVRGIQRVTRHPQNLGFALFGLAHCLALPYAGDQVFFGGFVVYAVVSAIHQDRRTRAAGPAVIGEFQARTSAVPFGAILDGRQRPAFAEYSVPALIAALAAFVALRWLHPRWFGGFGG